MQVEGLGDRVPVPGAHAGLDERSEGFTPHPLDLAWLVWSDRGRIPTGRRGRVVEGDQLDDLADPLEGDLLDPRRDVGMAEGAVGRRP